MANNWNKIKSEYLNSYISQRNLAEKHGIPYQTLRDRATKEKWFDQRKVQREKISQKTEQKAVEILAQKEADRLLRISNAADELLAKLELATKQLDIILVKNKKKYKTQVVDPNTKELTDVYVEEETPKSVGIKQIDRVGLKQLASTLKDLRDIQFKQEEEKPQEPATINISVVAATPADMEVDED